MSVLKQFVFFILTALLFISCQKETNSGNAAGFSAGTLKSDSTLDCFPSTVNGQYTTDSALSRDNFIDIQADISLAGSYAIQSDTVNGYSFKGTGTLGRLGLNTIRLYGTGIPLVAGDDEFIIRYGTSFCVAGVTVDQAGVDAVYNFGGAGATCTGTLLGGDYTHGVAMNITNTATVALQITSAGNFFISTLEINGVTFSATGTFPDISQPTVILNATGTPLAAGTFNFPLLGNGTGCAFSITFL